MLQPHATTKHNTHVGNALQLKPPFFSHSLEVAASSCSYRCCFQPVQLLRCCSKWACPSPAASSDGAPAAANSTVPGQASVAAANNQHNVEISSLDITATGSYSCKRSGAYVSQALPLLTPPAWQHTRQEPGRITTYKPFVPAMLPLVPAVPLLLLPPLLPPLLC